MSNEPRKPTDDWPPEDWVGLARRPGIPWRTERRFYDLPRKWWLVVETREIIEEPPSRIAPLPGEDWSDTQTTTDLERERNELRAEVARLTRERDEAIRRREEIAEDRASAISIRDIELRRQDEEIKRLTRERDEAKSHARLAFVEGCAWWEFHRDGATIWPSDRDIAEAEAERRYPGTGWPTHGECVREAERELDELRAELAPVREARKHYEHLDFMLTDELIRQPGWKTAHTLWTAIRRKP